MVAALTAGGGRISLEMKDFLRAFRGKERKAARWWATCLEKAGLPIQGRWGRCIGPREITALRARFAESDPVLLDVFEECYLLSSLEFAGRCPFPYTPDPLPKGWAKAA